MSMVLTCYIDKSQLTITEAFRFCLMSEPHQIPAALRALSARSVRRRHRGQAAARGRWLQESHRGSRRGHRSSIRPATGGLHA